MIPHRLLLVVPVALGLLVATPSTYAADTPIGEKWWPSVHGAEDQVIPVEHSQRLFDFASEPKELLIIDGVGHSGLWRNGLWDKVQAFWGRFSN